MKFFFIFFALLSAFVFSQEHSSDPYDPHAIFSQGKYKGQVMDTSSVRAIKLIAETESTFTLVNFWHAGHFWKAEIPKLGVEKLLTHIVYFPSGVPMVIGGHVQMRVVMKDGQYVKLSPQDLAHESAGLLIKDFIVSVEAVMPQGVPYSGVEGFKNVFAIATRFISTETKFNDDKANLMTQYPLNVSYSEANDFLAKAVRFGDERGYRFMYNTLTGNCATELFKIMDQTLKYPHSVGAFGTQVYDVFNPVAGPTIRAMKERALLIESSFKHPTLNDEITSVLEKQEAINSDGQCSKVLGQLHP